MWKNMFTCRKRGCTCRQRCECIKRCVNVKETFTYDKGMCECEKRRLNVERDGYMWTEMLCMWKEM